MQGAEHDAVKGGVNAPQDRYNRGPAEMQFDEMSQKIDFWRGKANEYLKRGLDAERRLSLYEGVI